MTTLAKLQRKGLVEPYEYEPGDGVRQIWLNKSSTDWIERVSPNVRDRGKDLLPIEQIKLSLDDFCMGRPLRDSLDIRRLDRLDNGIWELKTTDIRMFGCFVTS